jgi:hypothetical protein
MGYARVTGYDVGDVRSATLLISSGGDGTTAAVLTVTRPDGTTFLPAVQTTDGGTNWRTTLPYTITQAGDWVEAWVVSGKGVGAEGQIVAVAGTLLRMASQDVDADLIAAVYQAADATVIAALAEATCEQAADYLAKGWVNGSALAVSEVRIGNVQLTGLFGGTKRQGGPTLEAGQRLCPRALGVLQRAGLTGQPPNTLAAWFWG